MEDELFILWTNDNLITTEKMVFMYAHNSILEGWWKKVTLIIWGSTAQLVAENKKVQEKLIVMMRDGVKISACKACADQLGVSEKLEDMGIEVIYWGSPLTKIMKEGSKLLQC